MPGLLQLPPCLATPQRVNAEAAAPAVSPASLVQRLSGHALVDKLLQDVCLAACKLDSLCEQHDEEAVAWMLHVLGPLVQQPPQAARIVRQLGKGAQGHVHQAIAKDGQVFARKVCVLTSDQVAAGGVMVGLQDMVHAARCCMAVVKPALLDHLPRYIALHMQPLSDTHKPHTGSHKAAADESVEGVLVTLDMECLACNLTHYSRTVLHAMPTKDVSEANPALQGTPLGTRTLPLAPLLTITNQLLRGLRMLHQLGVVHCDIKPDNILLEVCPHTSTVQHAKLGDFGASCQMDKDGITMEARLATLTYQHPDKKCLRYEEQYAHYSSIDFDITELCASLLEVCLGQCPRTQLRAWLACSTVHELLLGLITMEEATKRSWQCSMQGLFIAAMENLEQQGPGGQVFLGLLRVLVQGWYTAGQVGLDALISDLQQVKECYEILISAGAQCDSVVLYGAMFPPSLAALDVVFSDMIPLQAVQLSCVHPDAWEQYTAFLLRHRGKAGPQAVRPVALHAHANQPGALAAMLTAAQADAGCSNPSQSGDTHTFRCTSSTAGYSGHHAYSAPSSTAGANSNGDSCQAVSSRTGTGEQPPAACCKLESKGSVATDIAICSRAPATPEPSVPSTATQGSWLASPTVITPAKVPEPNHQIQPAGLPASTTTPTKTPDTNQLSPTVSTPGKASESNHHNQLADMPKSITTPSNMPAASSAGRSAGQMQPASPTACSSPSFLVAADSVTDSVTLSPAGTLLSQLSVTSSLTLTPAGSVLGKASAACWGISEAAKDKQPSALAHGHDDEADGADTCGDTDGSLVATTGIERAGVVGCWLTPLLDE